MDIKNYLIPQCTSSSTGICDLYACKLQEQAILGMRQPFVTQTDQARGLIKLHKKTNFVKPWKVRKRPHQLHFKLNFKNLNLTDTLYFSTHKVWLCLQGLPEFNPAVFWNSQIFLNTILFLLDFKIYSHFILTKIISIFSHVLLFKQMPIFRWLLHLNYSNMEDNRARFSLWTFLALAVIRMPPPICSTQFGVIVCLQNVVSWHCH